MTAYKYVYHMCLCQRLSDEGFSSRTGIADGGELPYGFEPESFARAGAVNHRVIYQGLFLGRNICVNLGLCIVGEDI